MTEQIQDKKMELLKLSHIADFYATLKVRGCDVEVL